MGNSVTPPLPKETMTSPLATDNYAPDDSSDTSPTTGRNRIAAPISAHPVLSEDTRPRFGEKPPFWPSDMMDQDYESPMYYAPSPQKGDDLLAQMELVSETL